MDRNEVMMYYAQSELEKPVGESTYCPDDQAKFDRMIAGLSAHELAALVRSLSSYRSNQMYLRLTEEPRVWHRAEIAVEKLFLPRIDDRVEAALAALSRTLDRVVSCLLDDTCPEGGHLRAEFKDDGRPVLHQSLIVLEQAAGFGIIDGSHRAVILTGRGRRVFSCYIGRNA